MGSLPVRVGTRDSRTIQSPKGIRKFWKKYLWLAARRENYPAPFHLGSVKRREGRVRTQSHIVRRFETVKETRMSNSKVIDLIPEERAGAHVNANESQNTFEYVCILWVFTTKWKLTRHRSKKN